MSAHRLPRLGTFQEGYQGIGKPNRIPRPDEDASLAGNDVVAQAADVRGNDRPTERLGCNHDPALRGSYIRRDDDGGSVDLSTDLSGRNMVVLDLHIGKLGKRRLVWTETTGTYDSESCLGDSAGD